MDIIDTSGIKKIVFEEIRDQRSEIWQKITALKRLFYSAPVPVGITTRKVTLIWQCAAETQIGLHLQWMRRLLLC